MSRYYGWSAKVAFSFLVLTMVCHELAGEDKRHQAKELFDKGLAAEQKMDYSKAVEHYRQAQELFPETPQLNYRIGVCLQQAGQPSDAVKALKAFIKSGQAADESADATKRLDQLLLPKLTVEQLRRLEEGEDKLKAQSELATLALEGQAIDQIPAQEAVKLLAALNSEVPSYLPTSLKLASAYEHLKQYQNAFDAYDQYLKGYEKLGYPPADLRSVRVRRDVCAAHQRMIVRKQQTEAERKKAEVTITEKVAFLVKNGKCQVQFGRGFSESQSISFHKGAMAVTSIMDNIATKANPRGVTGIIQREQRVELKDLDPDGITVTGGQIDVLTRQREKKVHSEFLDNNHTDSVAVPGSDDSMNLKLFGPDEKLAQEMANSLRELIKLNQQEK